MKIPVGNPLLFRILLLGWVALTLAAGTAQAAVGAPEARVIIEGGWIRPLGELGASFDEADLGLGADAGYEAGFRLRVPLAWGLYVSPGFHFVDYKAEVVTDPADNEYSTEALSYRYTVEAMWLLSAGSESVRPFLAVSGGLFRNRVVGYYGDWTATKRDDSVNTFGVALRAGLVTEHFEFSVVGFSNEVETRRWFPTEEAEKYSWDAVSLRVGYALPW